MKNTSPHYLYQPILDLKALNLVRYEALLRIDGFHNIESFIIDCEKSNRIVSLDLGALSTLLPHIEQDTRLHNIPVAINISAVSLCDSSFQKNSLLMLARRASSCEISIEITETSPILDIKSAKRYVNELKTVGCTIGMDDYGSGHWSLADATELDVDYVKLSSKLTTNLQDVGITEAVIEAAEYASLYNLAIVAEHVDNEDQLLKLKLLGATHGQGWLFAKAGEPLADRNLFQAQMLEKLG